MHVISHHLVMQILEAPITIIYDGSFILDITNLRGLSLPLFLRNFTLRKYEVEKARSFHQKIVKNTLETGILKLLSPLGSVSLKFIRGPRYLPRLIWVQDTMVRVWLIVFVTVCNYLKYYINIQIGLRQWILCAQFQM